LMAGVPCGRERFPKHASGGQTPPKVWYLAFGYPRPRGIEVYLLHYATEMKRHGFDPRIVVFDPLPAERHWCLAALAERGIPIESLADDDAWRGCLRRGLDLAGGLVSAWARGRRPDGKALHRLATKRGSIRRLQKRLGDERPDIIHVKGRIITEAWDILPPRRTIIHIATRGHRDPSWSDAEVGSFRAFAERAARVFAPGSGVAETFKREFGVSRPVTTIFTMAPDALGAESAALRLRETHTGEGGRSRRFGTLCGFSPGKGIEDILEALLRFRQQGRELPFTFAGEGEMEGMVREFVASKQIQDVQIVRVKSPAEVLALMDVLVLPSESEAMPLAIVEGFMCCRPCIATRVGGIPDLVRDGVEGMLIEAHAPDQLFVAMRAFAAQDDSEFAGFAERARQRYESVCSSGRVGQEVAAHYRDIMAQNPGTAANTA